MSRESSPPVACSYQTGHGLRRVSVVYAQQIHDAAQLVPGALRVRQVLRAIFGICSFVRFVSELSEKLAQARLCSVHPVQPHHNRVPLKRDCKRRRRLKPQLFHNDLWYLHPALSIIAVRS